MKSCLSLILVSFLFGCAKPVAPENPVPQQEESQDTATEQNENSDENLTLINTTEKYETTES